MIISTIRDLVMRTGTLSALVAASRNGSWVFRSSAAPRGSHTGRWQFVNFHAALIRKP